mgnify:CR=1 FL=1
MFKIGNIEINGKVVLAPMAGVTSLAYRNFMKPFGVALTVTEMVSDCGLIYDNIKTLDYIKTTEEERPVAIQLFGSSAETICKAMDVVIKHNPNVDIFDINLGCPAPKVTKTGAGSALLKDPKKLEEMFKIICKHSPIPVTAKIRLGWNEETINFKENIKALENAGISAIGLHARTTRAGYAGKPRWDLLVNLRDEMKVPLIVSGDIYTAEDAKKALEITHADAVMVARGGVGNPNLIRQINMLYNKSDEVSSSSIAQSKKYLLEFADMLIKEKGEYGAMMVLRGIAPKFFLSMPDSKKIRNKLASALTTRESLIKILDEI